MCPLIALLFVCRRIELKKSIDLIDWLKPWLESIWSTISSIVRDCRLESIDPNNSECVQTVETFFSYMAIICQTFRQTIDSQLTWFETKTVWKHCETCLDNRQHTTHIPRYVWLTSGPMSVRPITLIVSIDNTITIIFSGLLMSDSSLSPRLSGVTKPDNIWNTRRNVGLMSRL
jgi:hypothetical protein